MKNKLIQRKVAQARIHNHMLIQAKKAGLEASIQIHRMLREQNMKMAHIYKDEENAN